MPDLRVINVMKHDPMCRFVVTGRSRDFMAQARTEDEAREARVQARAAKERQRVNTKVGTCHVIVLFCHDTWK